MLCQADLFIYLFILLLLKFKLRASRLLSRHFTGWPMPLAKKAKTLDEMDNVTYQKLIQLNIRKIQVLFDCIDN
jgi:hypothetical protein